MYHQLMEKTTGESVTEAELCKQSLLLHTSSQQLYSLCAWEDPMTRKTGYIPPETGLMQSWTPLPSSIGKVKFYSFLMSGYASGLDSEFYNASLKSSVSLTISLGRWNSVNNIYGTWQNFNILCQVLHCSFLIPQLFVFREFHICLALLCPCQISYLVSKLST